MRALQTVFPPPISVHWRSLSRRQAAVLLVIGLVLELPVRYVVRPDVGLLRPGNPWFDLRLRLAIEAGMLMLFVFAPLAAGASTRSVGIPGRSWTRWEWGALATIGGVEAIVVTLIAGRRWVRLWEMGSIPDALPWALGEFLFGFNQETGFRGLIMTGLLPLSGWRWACGLNTLVFLVGPLHGPGLVDWLGTNPLAAAGYAFGVIVHGVAFSWLRHRTDNVVLCGILHGIINGFMNGSGFALRALRG